MSSPIGAGMHGAAGEPGFYARRLLKPDGRALWLYGRAPIEAPRIAPAPEAAAGPPPSPHLRFHPLRGEWVIYAGHRQDRTFLPPPAYDPLAPTTDPAAPTELPPGRYDIAVFENRFPTMIEGAPEPPAGIEGARPARGACEVVVYTQQPTGSLGALPLAQIELVVRVWGERTRELGARPEIAYVMPFENRGVEVGVTLPHPHGQIYAYPFVPPIPARELAQMGEHLARTGRGLLEDLLDREARAGDRIVYNGHEAMAFVPEFARYAYEVWIAPRRPAPSFDALSAPERLDLARALRLVLLKLDGLFGAPMPYVLVAHQAPSDGAPHPEAHLHLEIYPALRMKGRLKYLAGSELGAGAFTADTIPEEKAAELRAVEVPLA